MSYLSTKKVAKRDDVAKKIGDSEEPFVSQVSKLLLFQELLPLDYQTPPPGNWQKKMLKDEKMLIVSSEGMMNKAKLCQKELASKQVETVNDVFFSDFILKLDHQF